MINACHWTIDSWSFPHRLRGNVLGWLPHFSVEVHCTHSGRSDSQSEVQATFCPMETFHGCLRLHRGLRIWQIRLLMYAKTVCGLRSFRATTVSLWRPSLSHDTQIESSEATADRIKLPSGWIMSVLQNTSTVKNPERYCFISWIHQMCRYSGGLSWTKTSSISKLFKWPSYQMCLHSNTLETHSDVWLVSCNMLHFMTPLWNLWGFRVKTSFSIVLSLRRSSSRHKSTAILQIDRSDHCLLQVDTKDSRVLHENPRKKKEIKKYYWKSSPVEIMTAFNTVMS